MIKKVSKSDLKLGMFIHDLNCGWMDHSFLRNSFMLRKEGGPEEDRRERHLRGLHRHHQGHRSRPAPTQAEVEAELTARIQDIPNPVPPPSAGDRTSHQEELGFAKQIQKEANKVIHDVLGDVRLGKQIQVERV